MTSPLALRAKVEGLERLARDPSTTQGERDVAASHAARLRAQLPPERRPRCIARTTPIWNFCTAPASPGALMCAACLSRGAIAWDGLTAARSLEATMGNQEKRRVKLLAALAREKPDQQPRKKGRRKKNHSSP